MRFLFTVGEGTPFTLFLDSRAQPRAPSQAGPQIQEEPPRGSNFNTLFKTGVFLVRLHNCSVQLRGVMQYDLNLVQASLELLPLRSSRPCKLESSTLLMNNNL